MFGAEIDWKTARRILNSHTGSVNSNKLSLLDNGRGYRIDSAVIFSKVTIKGKNRYLVFGFDENIPDVMRTIEKYAIPQYTYPILHGREKIGVFSVDSGWNIIDHTVTAR